ncbi:MAG: hypothetical protein WAM95_15205 [Bacillus sp. (in: firmicutes)]
MKEEWDEKYEVMVIKGVHYEFVVNHNDDFYHLQLSDQDIHELQKKSLDALNWKIWQELEKIGLTIRWDRGNYIEVVLR